MNEKAKKYNVIIVGGGVAGSFLALHLKKIGISNICIIEREKFPRIKPCTGLLTKAAYKLLLEIDIDPIKDLEYINHLHKGTKIFYKEKFQMTMNNEPNLYSPNIATRKDFDYYLYKTVKTNGIDFYENMFIKDIDFIKKIIETQNEEFQYDFLVFADGSNGISSKYSKINKKSICFEAVFQKKESLAFYDLHFGITRNGYAWIAETGEYCTIGFSDLYNDKTDYISLLIRFAKQNGYDIDKDIIRGAFVPMQISKKLTLNDSVLFIGDAAGLSNPLTMEGIYAALYTAKKASIAINKKDVSLYKKEIKSLIKDNKASRILSKFFFKSFFQIFFWKCFAKIFKKYIPFGYDKIIIEKEYSIKGAFKSLIDFYFSKK